MRSTGIVLLSTLASFALGGCPRGRCAESASGPLTWTGIAPDDVETTPLEHSVRFGIPLQAGARRVQLCFARPLDSAEVETFGTGPRHLMTKIDERRVAGDSLAVDLPLTFERLDIVVHHHLRPVPLPPSVRVGRSRAPLGDAHRGRVREPFEGSRDNVGQEVRR